MVDELVAAVETARASKLQHERDHEHVKELLVKARLEKPDLGPADLEEKIGRYLDRATISRITVPKLGDKLTRKRTRRPPRS